jgi:hypothetical protein
MLNLVLRLPRYAAIKGKEKMISRGNKAGSRSKRKFVKKDGGGEN